MKKIKKNLLFFLKKLKKALDKLTGLCYTVHRKREGNPTNQKGNKKMTYFKVSADFQINRYFNSFSDAEKCYNEMIRDGMSYVELMMVEDYQNYKSHSLKVYYK